MHFRDGKIIYPKKLRIHKKIHIGIVGSGKMANEHAKVISSYNHSITKIVSSSLSLNTQKLIKKYNIKKHFFDFEKAIKSSPQVDGWIICSSWNTLLKNLKVSLKYNQPTLIEKSIPISAKNLKKLIRNISKKKKKKISVGYNRNYYDFIPLLVRNLKEAKLDMLFMFLPDPYSKILKKQGKTIKKYLVKYITSHWISLIYKILVLCNIRFSLKGIKSYSSKNILNSKKLIFNLKFKNKKIPLIICLIPDSPINTSIAFYSTKKNFILSPIENLEIYKKIIVKKKNNQNIYKPLKKIFKVDETFKPGFRLQYFDFVQSCIFNKKKSKFLTTIEDLVKIYTICEFMQ
jgi:hypothetical protein|tara:strand:+ start:409 stop:1446 length:1038 start_codon:yes stop_codon:yes gene_type:complete